MLFYALLRVDPAVWRRVPLKPLLPPALACVGSLAAWHMVTSATSPLFFRVTFGAIAATCIALVRAAGESGCERGWSAFRDPGSR